MSEEDVRIVLQAQTEGGSLRGISRISGKRLGHSCQPKCKQQRFAQMVHNAEVQDVDTDAIAQ